MSISEEQKIDYRPLILGQRVPTQKKKKECPSSQGRGVRVRVKNNVAARYPHLLRAGIIANKEHFVAVQKGRERQMSCVRGKDT